MDSINIFLSWLENTPLARFIAESDWAFPTVESIHVVALTLVIGTIAIVDLRLLGVASVYRPYSELAKETLPCTWIAFVIAAVSGSLMFLSHAVAYYGNTAFRIKIVMLLLAGANMMLFQNVGARSVSQWDLGVVPLSGKVAAALSLTFWIAVVFFGRRIGFTMSPT